MMSTQAPSERITMELGLHLADFTWPAGPRRLGEDLATVARAAEDCGFAKLSVMDHVWQIGVVGPPEHERLGASPQSAYRAAAPTGSGLLAWSRRWCTGSLACSPSA